MLQATEDKRKEKRRQKVGVCYCALLRPICTQTCICACQRGHGCTVCASSVALDKEKCVRKVQQIHLWLFFFCKCFYFVFSLALSCSAIVSVDAFVSYCTHHAALLCCAFASFYSSSWGLWSNTTSNTLMLGHRSVLQYVLQGFLKVDMFVLFLHFLCISFCEKKTNKQKQRLLKKKLSRIKIQSLAKRNMIFVCILIWQYLNHNT